MAHINLSHRRTTRLAKTLVIRKYLSGIILRLKTSTSHIFGHMLLRPTLTKQQNILKLFTRTSSCHKPSYDGTPQLESSSDNSSCENSCNTQVFIRIHLTIGNINFTHLRTHPLAIDSYQTTNHLKVNHMNFVLPHTILRWHTST